MVRPDQPSRSDEFVRGMSEAIGGPLGTHATKTSGTSRYYIVARIVLALVCLTLAAHWLQKAPCQDGAWSDLKQYRDMCYTDVLALYYNEGLSDGQIPYAQHDNEYPVLTGVFMGVLGLPVHALAKSHPQINQGQWFYNLNALALGGLAVASVALMLGLRRRRPWDVAMFAVAPALLLTALVAFTVGIVTWAAVNLPVLFGYPDAWWKFFRFNNSRAIDWGTFWYLGDHFPFTGAIPGLGWFDGHIPQLNLVSYALFGLCCAGVAVLVFVAPHPPRLAQLAFLVLAGFLVFSKVWSQQYVLWLLPLAVLARPRWGVFLAWQAAEVLYFAAFYGELMAASSKPVFPETVFDLAALLRLITVVIFAGYVVRDILRPVAGEDPDGGVFNDGLGEPEPLPAAPALTAA